MLKAQYAFDNTIKDNRIRNEEDLFEKFQDEQHYVARAFSVLWPESDREKQVLEQGLINAFRVRQEQERHRTRH